MQGSALLAIWSDVAAQSETDYLHWLTREHTTERVTTSGFIAVRVFRADIAEAQRYLIVYELDSTDALDGPDYVGKLNNPTPWSKRIMPTLRNFVRGGGRVIAASGTGQGGFAAAVTCEDVPADGEALVEKIAGLDRICGVRLLETDQARTSVQTREKGMRKEDRSFGSLLLFDGLDAEAIRSGLAVLKVSIPAMPASPDIYRQVFALDRRSIAGQAAPQ